MPDRTLLQRTLMPPEGGGGGGSHHLITVTPIIHLAVCNF